MGLSLSPAGNADRAPTTVERTEKRKRRRGPGGLGRGLARILVDASDGAGPAEAGSGLVELVGGRSASRVDHARTSVADAALRALAAEFELRALVVARRPVDGAVGDDPAPAVEEYVPAEWSPRHGMGALVHQHLDALVDRALAKPEPESRHREVPVGAQRLWLGSTIVDGQVVAAVALRDGPLPPSSADRLIGAIVVLAQALIEPGADLALRQRIAASTRISLKSERNDVLAEVNADWALPGASSTNGTQRRTGVGRADEPILAVARAAAKACRPRCEILYAGTAPLGDGEAAVAVVRRQRSGIRIGWALGGRGDLVGVAEAVFTAAL